MFDIEHDEGLVALMQIEMFLRCWLVLKSIAHGQGLEKEGCLQLAIANPRVGSSVSGASLNPYQFQTRRWG
jgi:hypothetical protein